MGTEAGVHWVSDRAWCAQCGAVRHRAQKASSVFCKWKPLLCNPNLSLKERMKAFGASTLSSANVAESLLDSVEATGTSVESWCARLLSQMVGFKRNPNDDFATFWKKLHREVTIWPVFSPSAQLICTFARSTVSRGILPVSEMTVLCIRCWCAEIWLGGVRSNVYGARRSLVGAHPQRFTFSAGKRVWNERMDVRGWSVVETHEQWVGLRLRRISACGRLVKVLFSPLVADFFLNSRVKVTGFQRLVGFFCSSVGLLFAVPCLVWGGRPPSVVRPRTLHVTSRLGTSYPLRKRTEERERRERGPPCVHSKRLRVYVQNVPVCTGNMPTMLPVHTEDILNAHTGTC